MKSTTSQKDSGYALLSLLVAMTIGLALLASSMSKPSTRFVGQREMEEEAFFRAHQVSYAIQRYAELKGGVNPQNLPTKLEDLLKSVVVTTQMGIQEQHILRSSALIDPLTGTEWKPVRLGDPKIREFARTYQQFLLEQQAQLMAAGAGAQAMGAQQGAQFPPLLMFAAQAAGVNLANPSASDSKEEEEGKPTTASGFSLDLDSDNRPIVGVMSSLKKPMIRNYYGLDSYEKAIFIAGVPVPGNYPVPSGGGAGVQGGVPAGGTGGQQNEPDGRPRMVPGQFRRDNQ